MKTLLTLCMVVAAGTITASGQTQTNLYLIFGNGTYEGRTKNGTADGQGTWTSTNGVKYVGEFKDGKPNGQGTMTWPDGMKYVGEFAIGKKNGQGTYTWPDGHKYVGEWKDNKYNGQGTLTRPDGTKQSGEWVYGNFLRKGEVNDERPNGKQTMGATVLHKTMMGHWQDVGTTFVADNPDFKSTTDDKGGGHLYVAQTDAWETDSRATPVHVTYEVLDEDPVAFWLDMRVTRENGNARSVRVSFSKDRQEMYITSRQNLSAGLRADIADIVRSQVGGETATTTYKRIGNETRPDPDGQRTFGQASIVTRAAAKPSNPTVSDNIKYSIIEKEATLHARLLDQNTLAVSYQPTKHFSQPTSNEHLGLCMFLSPKDGPPLNESIIAVTGGGAYCRRVLPGGIEYGCVLLNAKFAGYRILTLAGSQWGQKQRDIEFTLDLSGLPRPNWSDTLPVALSSAGSREVLQVTSRGFDWSSLGVNPRVCIAVCVFKNGDNVFQRLASEVSTSTVSTTSIPPTGKTEEAQIAINGTVSVLKNDQGEVEAIAIVDGTGIETLIVGKEDVSKLLLLDQRRVRMTGYLKIVEVAAPVKRDSAGNKVPISQVEQRRLSPETIVDIGLVPLRVLTGVTIVGEKGP